MGFDELVEQRCITAMMAVDKLRKLMVSNQIYQNNTVLVKEMGKRLNQWINYKT